MHGLKSHATIASMPLPILHTTDSSPETLVRLFHKTELHWTQHLAEETQLDLGSAFTNPQLSHIKDANRVLGAALPEGMSATDAIRLVTEHYDQNQTKCRAWLMNPSANVQQTEPLI